MPEHPLSSSSPFRPLAGRPPFATDIDDSVYDRPAQPRRVQPKPENPNARSSAYNTYDNYLGDTAEDDNEHRNRDSTGALGVGMGLLGEMSDDSDYSEDEGPAKSAPKAVPIGKNKALYEAATRAEAASSTPALSSTARGGQPASSSPVDARQPPSPSGPGAPRQRLLTPTNQGSGDADAQNADRRGPPPNTDPRRADPRRPPGLTIPPASPSASQVDSSPRYPPSPNPQSNPSNVPSRNMSRSPMPAPIPQHAPTSVARPMPAFMKPSSPAPPRSPAPAYSGLSPMTPMPLSMQPVELPPSTPITPLFAAPPTPEVSKSKVTFKDEMAPPILRGGSEDTLLDRSPREKGGYGSEGHGSDESHASTVGKGPRPHRKDGDDFWRRFSMVAHAVEEKKGGTHQSAWLAKTQAGTKSYSRWVWVVGIIAFVAAVGGIGYGIYHAKTSGASNDPKALGGSANESNVGSSSSLVMTTKTGKGHQVEMVTTSDGSVIVIPTAPPSSVSKKADKLYVIQPTPTPTPTPGTFPKHRRRGNRQLFD